MKMKNFIAAAYMYEKFFQNEINSFINRPVLSIFDWHYKTLKS